MINATLITTATSDVEVANAIIKAIKPLFMIIFAVVIAKILFTNIYLISKASKNESKKPFGNYFMGVLFPDIVLILLLIVIWYSAPVIIQMF